MVISSRATGTFSFSHNVFKCISEGEGNQDLCCDLKIDPKIYPVTERERERER